VTWKESFYLVKAEDIWLVAIKTPPLEEKNARL
jgi:hypothetical protein